MNILEIMQQNQSYCSNHRDMPSQLQQKAKQLCWEYNKTSPKEGEKKSRNTKRVIWRLPSTHFYRAIVSL